MQISVTGHHMDVTPALREYVLNKVQRAAGHVDQLVSISVVLSVEKVQHKADATLLLAGKNLFAEAAAHEMYAAIDLLADKLTTLLRKYKEKLTDHRAEDVRGNRYS